MESKEALLEGGVSNGGGVVLCGNWLEQFNGGNWLEQFNGENGLELVSGDEMGVLEDFEAYLEVKNDRLTISWMDGESVIKGMVTAVEQEADKKIRMKEIEVANVKECLHSREVGTGMSEPTRLLMEKAWGVRKSRKLLSFNDVCVELDKMSKNLLALGNVAREQFGMFKKEIDSARGCNSIKRIVSSPELVELGGVLPEKQFERSLHLDRMLERLKSTVDAICIKANHVSQSSKIFLCEWQQELDLLGKIEDMMKQSVLKSLLEGFVQNAQCCGVHNVNWLEKLNDISSLRTHLDSIVKSLSISEAWLVSQGSHDLDHWHREALTNHVSLPAAFCEESGTLDASVSHVPKNYDFQQLKHMSEEELVNFFNNVIINLRRDHESALQKMTEKYFCLKREYLKERGSSVTHRKHEEFDVVRKKLPEVIMKLEEFLLETEKCPKLTNDIESMGTLKDKVEFLLNENRELRDCLTDKNNEIKCLEAQLSGAAEKLLLHSFAEENMRKVVADLESAVENSHIEAYLNEEVYKCALKELIGQVKCNSEEPYMKFLMMRDHDIILNAATIPTETRALYEIEDYDIQSLVVEELSGLIFKEVIKDAEGELHDLHREVLIEKENRICLETTVLRKENELRLEVLEKERLKQDILVLGAAMEQKHKLAEDLSISLSKERTQIELASRELSSLRENLSQQQTLIAESNRKFESSNTQLLDAVKQIEVNKMELHKLYEKLDQTKELLTEANKEKSIAYALAQERLDKLLSSEARGDELNKEVELAIDNIHGLSKIFDNFECRISVAIKRNDRRLEDSTSHLKSLTKMASVLRRKELMYKQKLDWRYADLKMAEAEVDLLGDEVDTLLNLLEKIYIVLDHYSPILKHYPGIIEILELVRRELSRASVKLSQSNSWQG